MINGFIIAVSRAKIVNNLLKYSNKELMKSSKKIGRQLPYKPEN